MHFSDTFSRESGLRSSSCASVPEMALVGFPYSKDPRSAAGFTLVEMMMVVTVLVTVAAIAIPNYLSSLRTARVIKAKTTLKLLQEEIVRYQVEFGGLPPTLAELGRTELTDPWGNPYVYLPYLPVVLTEPAAAPLVEPDPTPIFGPTDEEESGGGGGVGGGGGASWLQQVRSGQADLAVITTSLTPVAPPDFSSLSRRDRNMLPLNTDFDLFSIGPDRSSAAAITAPESLDDVIRADDGGFIGVAREY